jgi:L-alanine-DL-glutamate epimerase-like enolase superfamily enzyme
MKIVECRAAHFKIPRSVWWPLAIEDRTLAIDSIELITFEVTSDSGVTGFGYSYTLGRGGAAVHGSLESEVIPQLRDREITTPGALFDSLWMSLQRVGRGGVVSVALGAADAALWDLVSKAAELPLYQYLGVYREHVDAYGSSIDLGYELDELMSTVDTHLERGLRSVKIKVGRSLREDLERLAAVRERIGDERRLMVDANTGWDLPESLRRAKAMEEFDLTWIEEPMNPDDARGHAELQRHTSTPIASGETLFSVSEFAHYFELNAMKYVQADVARVGGITPWLRVATLAHAAHLPMAPHFMQDVHVHLLCSIPNAFILEHLPLLDALIVEPLVVNPEGTVTPPSRPGIGVEFKMDMLEPHRMSAN